MTTVNYKEWVTKFGLQAQLILKTDQKILHEACQILFDRIVERTPLGNPALWEPPYWPKGYAPGNLKDSWKIEFQGDTVVISNDAPYAYRVETGWSYKQAPEGMMRISLQEFSHIVDAVASKHKL